VKGRIVKRDVELLAVADVKAGEDLWDKNPHQMVDIERAPGTVFILIEF
jgi:hypothetical protein